MLREAAQNREGFGGTPRHRRHNAPQWPDESDCTKCTTKGRKE